MERRRSLTAAAASLAALLLSACDQGEARARDAGIAPDPEAGAAGARTEVLGDLQQEAPPIDPHQGMPAMEAARIERAVAVLRPVGESGVGGVVTFVAEGDGVRVSGRIEGLTPGRHGFHVHEYGDLTDLEKGESAGSHFSPRESPHGMPEHPQRHVGDLGNVEADESGVATFDRVDPVLRLEGALSILGRAIVVHERVDDGSQPTGNAGGRVAFAVIGVANPSTRAPAGEPPQEEEGGTGGGR